MIGVDTNVLVRYFAQDDPRQSRLAARFIEGDSDPARTLHVSLVTLAELVWVVRGRYAASKDMVVDIVAQLLSDARFVVQDGDAAWAALDVYRDAAVDFADALIAAVDRLHGCTHTVTLDRRAARIDGVTLLD